MNTADMDNKDQTVAPVLAAPGDSVTLIVSDLTTAATTEKLVESKGRGSILEADSSANANSNTDGSSATYADGPEHNESDTAAASRSGAADETPTGALCNDGAAELLGTGFLGKSFKRNIPGMNGPVVTKHVDPAHLSRPAAVRRLKDDAGTMAGITHPHLASVYSCTISDSAGATIVRDFVDGATLEEILLAQGFLDPEYCLEIFRQVADGLAGLHDLGIAHRNLKASNIVIGKGLNNNLFVKLLDGGMVRFIQTDADVNGDGGALFADTSYVSPEQCLGNEVDFRSDIYVFGLLMYEALTGRKPFEGGTKMQTVLKQINRKAKRLTKVCPDLEIPLCLENIVLKCLEKKPAARYQNAEELLFDLEDALSSLGEDTNESSAHTEKKMPAVVDEKTLKQHKHSLIVSLTTLMFIMLGVASVFSVHPRHRHYSGHDIVYSGGHIYNMKKMSYEALTDLGERLLQQQQALSAINAFDRAAQKAEAAGAAPAVTGALNSRIGQIYALLQQQSDGKAPFPHGPASQLLDNSTYVQPSARAMPVLENSGVVFGPHPHRVLTSAAGGDSYGRLAEHHLDLAISQFSKDRKLGLEHKELLETLADVKFRLQKLEESEMLRTRLLKIADSTPAPNRGFVSWQYANLGATQLAAGRPTDAVASLNKAFAIDNTTHTAGALGSNSGLIQLNLAKALKESNRFAEAESLLGKLQSIANSAGPADTKVRIYSGELLSEVLRAQSKNAQADKVDLKLLSDLRQLNEYRKAGILGR